jgi:hypothetical protein
MNFVFESKSKKEVRRRPGFLGVALFVGVGVLFLVLWAGRARLMNESDLVEEEPGGVLVEGDSFSTEQALRIVSDSFGVPYEPVVKLSEFLVGGNFSGVGLFRVKPGHLALLEDRFVPGAVVDLEDPVMNANIALGLLAGFRDRGYSWEQCFLIYVFGWGELAPATRSVEAQEFVDFVFGGGR